MKRKIHGGIYLVVDPSLGIEALLPKIQQALDGGIDVLQIWNNWHPGQNKTELINAVCELAHKHNIPVLINEDWTLLQQTELDGVHFDEIPAIDVVRKCIARPFVCGITCGNDLSRVQWANDHHFDYISFCSLFPSPSAGVCEIVRKETVQAARQLTSLPIFLAGGITQENLELLANTGLNGIALISAILKADDPQSATQAFKNKLNALTTHETIVD